MLQARNCQRAVAVVRVIVSVCAYFCGEVARGCVRVCVRCELCAPLTACMVSCAVRVLQLPRAAHRRLRLRGARAGRCAARGLLERAREPRDGAGRDAHVQVPGAGALTPRGWRAGCACVVSGDAAHLPHSTRGPRSSPRCACYLRAWARTRCPRRRRSLRGCWASGRRSCGACAAPWLASGRLTLARGPFARRGGAARLRPRSTHSGSPSTAAGSAATRTRTLATRRMRLPTRQCVLARAEAPPPPILTTRRARGCAGAARCDRRPRCRCEGGGR